MKIKSKHQQPSFKFQTSIAEYEVNYTDEVKGEEEWVVSVKYLKGVTGIFRIPIDWSREYVFDWLSRMEENSLD